MRQRHLAGAASVAAVLALGACAGDPTYYTLAETPGTAQQGGPRTVEVQTPSVASFLDRDYIVSETRNYELKLAGNRAWAEPLADMVGRTFAADIADRLPRARVFSENSAVSAGSPDARVELDIGRFDKDASGQAVLQATLVVRAEPQGAAPAALVPILLRETPSGSGTDALVASLSRMLGEAADRAAVALTRVPIPLPDPAPLSDGA